MLRTRILTAVVLLVALILILLFSSMTWFGLAMALVASFAAWEWWRLIYPQQAHRSYSYAGLVLLVQSAFFFYLDYQWVSYLLALTVLFWFIAVPLLMHSSVHLDIDRWRLLLALSGLLIFPSAWFSLMQLRALGISVLLSVFVLVWIADIGAYFVGKQIGRHKLAINLSPGKSIEGAIGGIALVVLFASLSASTLLSKTYYEVNFYSILVEHHGWLVMLMTVFVLACMSVVGDLFESQLKRLAGVKDSSSLLPGHGGVLDRIDALLPVLPLASLILQWSIRS